ncbi:MAG: CHAT domain-containing tetratricopeptide repeat protein [Bacteroidota bacterium]
MRKVLFFLFFSFSFGGFAQSWEELDATMMTYFDKQEYKTALVYAEKTLLQAEKEFGKKHVNYALSLGSVAFLQSTLGDFEAAIETHQTSLIIWEILQGKNSEAYSRTLNNLANCYVKRGHFSKAIGIYKEDLEISKQLFGEEDPNYATSLHNLATLYYDIDQFDLAMPLYEKAIAIFSKDLDQMAEKYAMSVNNLANILSKYGRNEEATKFYLLAKNILKEKFGVNHPYYVVALGNLAEMYRQNNQVVEAVSCFKEVVQLYETRIGTKHIDYAKNLNNLALLHFDINQYQACIDYYKAAISVIKEVTDGHHPDYMIYLNNLAKAYDFLKDPENEYLARKEAVRASFQYINDNFSYLSEKEKETLTESLKSLYSTFNSFAAEQHTNFQDLGALSFDVQLATKGMVLQSTIQMRESIQKNGDKKAIEKFEYLIELRNQMAKLSTSKEENATQKIKEIELAANQLEGELTQLSSEFKAFNSVGKISWKDVQLNLKEGEVAIEFSAFDFQNRTTNKFSKQYVAIVLKLNQEPQLIPLFDEVQLQSILASENVDDRFINSIYRGESSTNTGVQVNLKSRTKGKLYELLWKPLENELLGTKKIYFAPTGILNTISFAAIAINDTTLLSDNYHFVQLTTTANIVNRSLEVHAPTNITLFGGIDFENFPSETGVTNDPSTNDSNTSILASRGNQNWNYLPGTLKEINAIENRALQQHIACKKWVGSAAGESTFKLLSKDSPEVLHLATHGFYIPLSENGEKNSLVKNTVNPLHQSGLVLAGGNVSWNQSVKTDGEDGILTAYEVSNLSLSKTNLVVLSACETGLGQIKGNEGVYGLQRAFKMAGVEYIIMSLWQIPDKESAEFMEFFYSHYFTSGDIEKSFQTTQKTMRNIYYDDPYKWAAFVLVR